MIKREKAREIDRKLRKISYSNDIKQCCKRDRNMKEGKGDRKERQVIKTLEA